MNFRQLHRTLLSSSPTDDIQTVEWGKWKSVRPGSNTSMPSWQHENEEKCCRGGTYLRNLAHWRKSNISTYCHQSGSNKAILHYDEKEHQVQWKKLLIYVGRPAWGKKLPQEIMIKGQLEGTVNFHDLCGDEPINYSYCRTTSHFHQCDAAEIRHTKHWW